MPREWNTKAGWIATTGGGPLPFVIRDDFDWDRTLTLVKSYTKPGTKYIRIHIFERQESWCDCCGHLTPGKKIEIEVNTYGNKMEQRQSED